MSFLFGTPVGRARPKATGHRQLLVLDGRPVALTIAGLELEWLPLAHPAAPTVCQQAHKIWRDGRRAVTTAASSRTRPPRTRSSTPRPAAWSGPTAEF